MCCLDCSYNEELGAFTRKEAFVSSRFLLGVAALLLMGTACSSSKPAAAAKGDKNSKPAPEFTLQDANGKTVKLTDFKGKVVLLDFWATWCGPCKLEIPWFIEFQRKYKDRGFSVLGVSMDDDGWQSVKPFIQEIGMNYRVVLGDDKTGDKYGGIEALPTAFLLDAAGRVASTHVGLSSRRDLEDGIEKLLAEVP